MKRRTFIATAFAAVAGLCFGKVVEAREPRRWVLFRELYCEPLSAHPELGKFFAETGTYEARGVEYVSGVRNWLLDESGKRVTGEEMRIGDRIDVHDIFSYEMTFVPRDTGTFNGFRCGPFPKLVMDRDDGTSQTFVLS